MTQRQARKAAAALALTVAGVLAVAAGRAAAPDEAIDAEPGGAPAGTAASAAVIGVDPDNLTCFMGGAEGSSLVRADELAMSLRDGQDYRLYDLAGAHERAIAIGPPRNEGSEGECSDLWRQDLSLPPRKDGGFAVALHAGGARSPLPKVLETVAEPTEEQRKLLDDFLARRGIANPDPQFRQIIRTDLEGDGIDEIILNVVRVNQEHARVGDHSLLLVVRGSGPTLRSYVLQDEVTVEDSDFSSTLWVNRVVAVVDIDGDGIAEIVTNGGYIYGGGWEAIRWDGSGFEYVMFCGCDG